LNKNYHTAGKGYAKGEWVYRSHLIEKGDSPSRPWEVIRMTDDKIISSHHLLRDAKKWIDTLLSRGQNNG
jgi:hypothetical protein